MPALLSLSDWPVRAGDAVAGGVDELLPGRCGRSLFAVDMSAEFSRDSMDSGTEDEPGGAVDATTGGVEELLPGRCGRSLLDGDMSAELSRDIEAGCVGDNVDMEEELLPGRCGRSFTALERSAEFSRRSLEPGSVTTSSGPCG